MTSITKPTQTEPLPTAEKNQESYRYAHLLPHFSQDRYPPLTPFEHVDPGHRALNHANPRAFLENATSIAEITPHLGTEVVGVNLVELDSDGRDQLALETEGQTSIVNGVRILDGASEHLDFGGSPLENKDRFRSLHIHPTSGHPRGYPEIHLVYRDADSNFNFEYGNSVTSILWHSDVSYERQPPGLTTFFLLDQPKSGGDTLFASQVAVLKKLSPQFVAFLRTLKAVHSGVQQAEFSRSGKVGLKREESGAILNFLYDHIDKSADNQARIKWAPYTVVIWDNRITAHSAIVDYKDTGERRHGARITSQAERPIPALGSLEV
ncbi:hypothetical protein APHAL10511_006473 [Amanita phalloides]|nr:hypothetical protein APHAL10511_006473 [Amanita phalloides]